MWLFRKIWGIYWYIVFSLVFFCFVPILFITMYNPRWHQVGNWVRVQWARLTFGLTLMPWKVDISPKYKELRDDPSRKTGIIFTPNHTSFADIPLFGLAIRGNFKFFAKKELEKIPILGKLIANLDILVDRSNPRQSVLALRKAGDALDGRVNMCIFPEGTTNNKGSNLMSFKAGPFKLAIEKQLPIVPVTFLDNFRLFLNDGRHLAQPGVARVVIHDPIDTAGMSVDDITELSRKVHTIIQNELDKHYANR